MRKRAFDEITICRRATEEALRALAEHFPVVDRSELEEPVKGLQAAHPSARRRPCQLDLSMPGQP